MGGISGNFDLNSQLVPLMREFLFVISDFGKLLDSPEELRKRIKDAIQLSEAEQKKVSEAMAYLDQAAVLKNNLAQREATVSNLAAQTNEDVKRVKEAQSANHETSKKLSAITAAQAVKEAAHKETDAKHANQRAQLDNLQALLAKQQAEVEAKAKAVAEQDRVLNEKAERLRRAAEGL